MKSPWAARGLPLAAALVVAACAFSADLTSAIPRAIAASPEAQAGFWGIQVVDIASGRTLYKLNSSKLFVPASNTKLFTGAMALTRLGAGFTFQTRVLSETAPDPDGRVRGPLILIGGGDPNLSGRAIPYRAHSPAGDALAAIGELADQVAARGVKRVEGGIIGDDSWYVWEPYADGWAVDDPQYDYGAPVSALAINDNTVALRIRPGARIGDLAGAVLDPAIEYYEIENRIRTTGAAQAKSVSFEREPGAMQVRLWGTIPLGDAGETLLLGIQDPARYAGLALREALAARGISVGGGAEARHFFRNEAAEIEPGGSPPQPAGVELARRASAPLVEDLRIALKESQNLHAEMALRAVARARQGVGSREAGIEELKIFLAEAGIEKGAFDFNDGSGLARLNLVSPAAVVKLLQFMHASAAREDWLSLLAVAGVDGTLSERFAGGPAAGRILAKTGTVGHVSALSGYARRTSGRLLAFSILVNNYQAPVSAIRGVIDRICTLMVE